MVNLVRDQSHDAPSFFNCSRMIPPYFSFHSHAYLRNSSLVSDDFLMPFSRSMATTRASVAIEAWSVPGTQQASLPSILALRMSTSWMVLFSVCPICRTPVTLGGGITMQYGSLSRFGDDRKKPCSIQYRYHLSSTPAGSYFVDNILWGSSIILFPSFTFLNSFTPSLIHSFTHSLIHSIFPQVAKIIKSS